MRFRNRKPYKVTPEKLALIRAARERGATYAAAGELAGVSRDCARKWLTGRTPVRAA